MLPKIQICFYMAGTDVALEDLTKSLGLQPTRTRKKEEWPQASILAGVAQDVWELRMDQEGCNAVSLQIDKLQTLLSDKIDLIQDLEKRYLLSTSVTVIVEMKAGDGPELVLSKENISFLSQIHAEIGFDLYIDE